MNTFRNKQFKNQLDTKYTLYDCLRSSEPKSSSEKNLEECMDSCYRENFSNDLTFQK